MVIRHVALERRVYAYAPGVWLGLQFYPIPIDLMLGSGVQNRVGKTTTIVHRRATEPVLPVTKVDKKLAQALWRIQ